MMGKPKIRFKGYNEDWEQRKVGDYLTESREIGNKGDVARKMTVKLWGKGVYEKLEAGSTNTQYFIRHANQFIYSKLDFLNCAFGVVPEELESLETTADVPAFDCVYMNPYFMFYRTIQPSFYIQNGIIANGSRKAKRIHTDTFLEMPISVPCLTEQNKIVGYFQSLDHLITLHHRKRVILKKTKVSDWEQRKFSELYKKVNEKNIFRFGVDKIISVANMYFKEDVKKPNDEYMRTYNIMRLGDIAFEGNKSKNFSHGRFVENTIGDGIVSHVFDVFRPVMDYDLLFWKYLINNENVMGRIMTRCTKASTMMTNLVAKDFLNENILVPTIEEQHKIGTYIDKLDHLITLHQHKCDEMKKLKKCMLQKMFPQNGKKVPEIRFEGFTNDWEQRKLGEVFEQTTNFVNLSKDDIELWSLTVEDGLTPKSERYNREFLVKKDTNFKEVRPGDIVYNPMNMTLGAVGYNGMSKSVAISGYYTTMITKDGNDSYYINTWLKSPQAISLYKIYATGSLIEKQRVQFPTLSTIPAVFPKYEEQHKIGCYFEAIDHLITLHQHKCDELQNLKKYMLQNMFV